MKLQSLGGLLAVLSTTTEAVKFGFVGDTGIELEKCENGVCAGDVFKLMEKEGVDLVLQNGDFDYVSSPDKWDAFLDEFKEMNVLVTSGNHEEQFIFGYPWYGEKGYKARMKKRHDASPLADSCTPRDSSNLDEDYGEYMSCKFGNAHFVMIGWKQLYDGYIQESADFIRKEFEKSDSPYKFCVWHRPGGLLNPGNRHLYEFNSHLLYNACRDYGAMVTSGHSHLYSRTKLLNDFDARTIDETDDAYNVTTDCGKTISIVSGMGGYKFEDRGEYAEEEYFQAMYTYAETDGVERAGVLICETVDATDPPEMMCEFKLTGDEEVVDKFDVIFAGKNCHEKIKTSGVEGASRSSFATLLAVMVYNIVR